MRESKVKATKKHLKKLKKGLDKQLNISYNKDVKKINLVNERKGVNYDKENDKERNVRYGYGSC